MNRESHISHRASQSILSRYTRRDMRLIFKIMIKNIGKKIKSTNPGFTLIELLIVIGIIAILAAFVFVMLNPLARFQDARNARRWADVNAILSAVKLYEVDNHGTLPTNVNDLVPGLFYQIGRGEAGFSCSNPAVALEPISVELNDLVTAGYLPSMPFDSNANGASADQTHYYISRDNHNDITIGACGAENGSNSSPPAISVSR